MEIDTWSFPLGVLNNNKNKALPSQDSVYLMCTINEWTVGNIPRTTCEDQVSDFKAAG